MEAVCEGGTNRDIVDLEERISITWFRTKFLLTFYGEVDLTELALEMKDWGRNKYGLNLLQTVDKNRLNTFITHLARERGNLMRAPNSQYVIINRLADQAGDDGGND